jgi:hypothetical protein
MFSSKDVPNSISQPDVDPDLQHQVERLHRLTVYGRWLVAGGLWLTVAPPSLWDLRYPISLIQEHFTWAAVRYGLVYHRFAAIGLAICIGTTVAILVWQSRNILVGLPERDKQRLIKQVLRIRQQGASHPLWQWVCKKQKVSS